MDSYERRKKSDKARDKAGMPSTRHVRAYEALIEKRLAAPLSAAEQHSIVKPGKK
jgi:hypothetical protein